MQRAPYYVEPHGCAALAILSSGHPLGASPPFSSSLGIAKASFVSALAPSSILREGELCATSLVLSSPAGRWPARSPDDACGRIRCVSTHEAMVLRAGAGPTVGAYGPVRWHLPSVKIFWLLFHLWKSNGRNVIPIPLCINIPNMMALA